MKLQNSLAYPIIVLLLIVAFTALAVGQVFSSRYLREALQIEEVDKLKAIEFIVGSLVKKEIQRLQSLSGLMQENNELTAAFVAFFDSGRIDALIRAMERLRGQLSLDIFDALSPAGELIYSADLIGGDHSYQDTWGIDEAKAGQSITATSFGPDGWAFRSFVPILMKGELLGILVIGKGISDQLARDIALATNTQISLASTTKTLASSLPADQRKLLDWELAGRSLVEKRTFFVFEESAAQVFLYAPLMMMDETLCVILQSSTREVSKLWRKQIYALGWVSLTILGAVASLGALLTMYIIRPLKRLRENARDVALQLTGGEWTESESGDEVHVLVQVFDTLVKAIHQYVVERDLAEQALLEIQSGLERRVEERTGELRNANASLQAQIRQREQAENALKQTLDDLKNIQAQLIQSAKLASIGELASGVAHELNQPLMVIRTTAQLLQKSLAADGFNSGNYRERVEAIIRNTGRMMNIIGHLRTFSRQTLAHFSPLELNRVIEDSFLMMSEQLRLRGIEIEKHLSDGLPQVWGDAIQLEQVLLNLISNARDAILEVAETPNDSAGKPSRAARRIEIHSRICPEANDEVEVLVKDTGTGIPDQQVDKVFDPFFTTKEVGKGTGLGLSISYGIVEGHAGRIEVAETGPSGTVMRVRLPACRTTQSGLDDRPRPPVFREMGRPARED